MDPMCFDTPTLEERRYRDSRSRNISIAQDLTLRGHRQCNGTIRLRHGSACSSSSDSSSKSQREGREVVKRPVICIDNQVQPWSGVSYPVFAQEIFCINHRKSSAASVFDWERARCRCYNGLLRWDDGKIRGSWGGLLCSLRSDRAKC